MLWNLQTLLTLNEYSSRRSIPIPELSFFSPPSAAALLPASLCLTNMESPLKLIRLPSSLYLTKYGRPAQINEATLLTLSVSLRLTKYGRPAEINKATLLELPLSSFPPYYLSHLTKSSRGPRLRLIHPVT